MENEGKAKKGRHELKSNTREQQQHRRGEAYGKLRKPKRKGRKEVKQEGAAHTATETPQSPLSPEAFIVLDSRSHYLASCSSPCAHILPVAQYLSKFKRRCSSELLI